MPDESPTDLTTLSDETLLGQFVRSDSQDAFRAIVERYGPFVLSTCRRGTPSATDADDAFQATFLVLAQSAGKVRNRRALAAWLYGVACRICVRLRRDKARHGAKELSEAMVIDPDPLDELLARHDEMVTDEELALLPEKLRTPLVLRYLVGKSNEAVARELGITVAALEGRLKRAKKQLRMRLIRRGVTLAVAVATLKATRVTASQIPQDLIAQTMSTCCGPELSSNVASAAANPATQLALEELNVMNAILISKPLAIACLVTAAATLAIGAQLAVSQSPSDRGGSTITLDTHAELVAADSPNGQLNLAQRRDDTSPTGTSGELSLNDFEITSQPQNGESLTLSDERLGIESSATENSFFDSPERTPNRFDVKSSTPIENKIRKTLTRAISGLDFHETPLEDIVGFLQDECEIPIQLDRRALDDEGFGVDEPVTILLRGVKLESALRLMLRDLQLTYTVQDEVLLITTESVAASTLETRVYPVADLELKTDSLKDVITATVATESWSVNGGGESEIRTLGDALVISTTYAIHEEIQQLFQQLQDLNRQ